MMRHADKTVTVYRKEWDADKAVDVYHGLVIPGVSIFCRVATAVTTDGLTASNEVVCRIPAPLYSKELRNGDLICEGAHKTSPQSVADIPNPFVIVGITKNTSGKEPHIKVVAK